MEFSSNKSNKSAITVQCINYKVLYEPNTKQPTYRQNIVNIRSMISKLTQNDSRNKFILKTVSNLYSKGFNILVLSDCYEHINSMFEDLIKIDSNIYQFTMNRVHRESWDKINKIIIMPYGMTLRSSPKEKIDVVILTTPRKYIEKILTPIIKNNPSIQQIIDITDVDNYLFVQYSQNRNEYYTNQLFSCKKYFITETEYVYKAAL
ncbi:putative ATP-dependent RNA helicase [Hirudovirus strain Sangsue]|nr:putative ATP-dependent RNA helicase [Hirudovirus strain Sangsue]